jgi:ribose transport system permease protein
MDSVTTEHRPSHEALDTGPARRLGSRLGALADLLGMVAVLAALVVFFGLLSQHFWTWRTLQSVLNQVPDLMVVATGMTLVMIAGGIDLSVGSVLALSGAMLGIAMTDWHWPLLPAAAACLGTGALCGFISGAVSVLWSIPSFIVTLGMLEVARGAAYLATHSETRYIGPRVESVAQPLPGLGISPAFLIAIGVVLAGQILLECTVWGRHLVAVGANEQAARFAGIATRRIKGMTFVISGALAAAGAIFQVARLSSADPNGGIGLELAAIAAVVIGGTSLMGGYGSVLRSSLGVLIIAVLQTGLAQAGATEPAKRLITGAVIVLAVVTDVQRRKWSKVTGRVWSRLLPPLRGTPRGAGQ